MIRRGSMMLAFAVSALSMSVAMPATVAQDVFSISGRRYGRTADEPSPPSKRSRRRRKLAMQAGRDSAGERKKKRNMRHVSRRVRLKHRKAA